ncbi:MAG: hypothetical protein R3E61_09270 [Pseudomonadales bacterium]
MDYDTVAFEDIAGKGANQLSFNQIDLEKQRFMPLKMPISPCACIENPVATTERHTGVAIKPFDHIEIPCFLHCRASSATACWSMSNAYTSTA